MENMALHFASMLTVRQKTSNDYIQFDGGSRRQDGQQDQTSDPYSSIVGF